MYAHRPDVLKPPPKGLFLLRHRNRPSLRCIVVTLWGSAGLSDGCPAFFEEQNPHAIGHVPTSSLEFDWEVLVRWRNAAVNWSTFCVGSLPHHCQHQFRVQCTPIGQLRGVIFSSRVMQSKWTGDQYWPISVVIVRQRWVELAFGGGTRCTKTSPHDLSSEVLCVAWARQLSGCQVAVEIDAPNTVVLGATT